MYIYDYYYANKWDGTQNYGTEENPVRHNTEGWIYITHGGSYPSNVEWLITRYGLLSSGYYYAWGVFSNGHVDVNALDNAYSVRPVFYLTNQITLTGTGTSTDPYIIGSPSVS